MYNFTLNGELIWLLILFLKTKPERGSRSKRFMNLVNQQANFNNIVIK